MTVTRTGPSTRSSVGSLAHSWPSQRGREPVGVSVVRAPFRACLGACEVVGNALREVPTGNTCRSALTESRAVGASQNSAFPVRRWLGSFQETLSTLCHVLKKSPKAPGDAAYSRAEFTDDSASRVLLRQQAASFVFSWHFWPGALGRSGGNLRIKRTCS